MRTALASEKPVFSSLVVLLTLGGSIFAGVSTFWSDSEMWAAGVAKYLFSSRSEYSFIGKMTFNWFLYLNSRLSLLLSVHPMETARWLMALNSIGIVAALFLILKHLKGTGVALTGVAFLLSISIFIKRAEHVRSDLLVSHLFLWVLYWRLAAADWRRSLGFFLIADLVGLTITPKALIWILSFIPLYFTNLRQALRSKLFLGAVAILTAVAAFILRDSIVFFLNSFSKSEVGVPYFSWARWQHVTRLIVENPHFILSLIIGNASLLWRRNRRRPDSLDYMAWVMILIFALYPDRLPFLIAALLPFLVIQVVSIDIFEIVLSKGWVRTGIIGIGAVIALYWCLKIRVEHSNNHQKSIAIWLERAVETLPRGIHIYDPSGILFRTEAQNWFLGPGQRQKNKNVLEQIDTDKPEVILYTAKLRFLEPDISQRLHDFYNGGAGGIYVRALKYPSPGDSISAITIMDDIRQAFPRLWTDPSRSWIVRIRDRSGIEVTRQLAYKTLEDEPNFALPPNVIMLTVQPFQLNLPFNTDLASQFRFDVEF